MRNANREAVVERSPTLPRERLRREQEEELSATLTGCDNMK